MRKMEEFIKDTKASLQCAGEDVEVRVKKAFGKLASEVPAEYHDLVFAAIAHAFLSDGGWPIDWN